MSDELKKIREAYFAKAIKDRKTIKKNMQDIFGYGERNAQHKISGTSPLTDRETEYLFRALKLKK